MLDGYKKRIAAFLILVVVFSFFNIIAIAPKEVKAAELPYYCVQGKVNPETGSRDYCFSGDQAEIEPLCDGSVSLGNPEDDPRCQLRTCVPADGGVCLSNVPEIKCQSEGGVPYNQPKESVAACQLGCCNRGGVCSVSEQNECPTAIDGGFSSGLTNQLECSQSCLPPVRGCCEMVGECSYTTSDTCDVSDPNVVAFHDDRYCHEVSSCSVLAETHSYMGCGNQEGGFQEEGSQHKVYWYDVDGNREELVPDGVLYEPGEEIYGNGDCGYPDYVCEDPDGPGGEVDAYCRSTSCLLEGDCPDCDIQEFLNGDTICLNILID